MARFNHLHKPFDNAKVRQAAIAAIAGALPACAGRREGALQDLRLDVHLQHALRQPGRQRHPDEVAT
jgi:hypothetical protein